jgi:glyoxylase-like metal-dependent hydrolase (beta-lactamase superfamily II)
MAKEIATELPGSLVRFEYAPRLECIPIRSNTLPPFHATNLITMLDDGDLLIVDPGSNEAGRPHLEAVLQRISPQRLHVFLTHHHHDHIQSLDVVERLFPEAVVIGHPYTLKKLKECRLKQIPVCGGEVDEVYRIGSREVMCISLPGHTRGHLALWEESSRTLISGDHTVGFGSSVLDPDGGGDMVAYLASTQRLLKLNAQIILPCHGFPTLTDPNELLQTYINHRIEREKEILQAWNSGSHNVDDIIAKVYVDTPAKLHVAAKRNVWLHLDKLQREGALELPPEILAEIQKHHDPEADL